MPVVTSLTTKVAKWIEGAFPHSFGRRCKQSIIMMETSPFAAKRGSQLPKLVDATDNNSVENVVLSDLYALN